MFVASVLQVPAMLAGARLGRRVGHMRVLVVAGIHAAAWAVPWYLLIVSGSPSHLVLSMVVGVCVLTGVGDFSRTGLDFAPSGFAMYGKRRQGSLFGSCSPHRDVPRQIELYRSGMLKVDELITRTYTQDEIARGYVDLHAGCNVRGVVVF